MIKFGNDIIKVNNSWLTTGEPTPPGPVFPYKTVQITRSDYDETWFAENLHEDDGGDGIYRVDNVTANGVDYGTQYFYSQSAARRIANNFEGWHLPTYYEYYKLLKMDATYSLLYFDYWASTSGWNNNLNGNDVVGFNAIPVGEYIYGQGIQKVGSFAGYWCQEYYDAFLLGLNNNNKLAQLVNSFDYSRYAISVRLVKDKE